MEAVCKRLPPTEATLRFLSPFFEQEHVRAGLDDRMLGPYGYWRLFAELAAGKSRAYGVFELDDHGDAVRFFGFQLGTIDADGFCENHAFWNRKAPTVQCVTLCCDEMRRDHAADGTTVRGLVEYIPECHRAAKWLALRFGCRDCGLRPERRWLKNGKFFHCREFRMEW